MTVERFLAQRAAEREGVGAPISRRSRHTQRTLDAYLRAGGRPRWMERLGEIQGRMAMERRRLERRYRALRQECGSDPRRVRPPLARARRGALLRAGQRAHPPAQRVVSDRARPADGPAHARLRADPRALLPARGARRGRGCSRSSRPGLTAPLCGHPTRTAPSSTACASTAGASPSRGQAPRPHPGGERAQRLAGVRLRPDPALRLAAAADSSSTPSRSVAVPAEPATDELEPAGAHGPARPHGERRAGPRADRAPADVARSRCRRGRAPPPRAAAARRRAAWRARRRGGARGRRSRPRRRGARRASTPWGRGTSRRAAPAWPNAALDAAASRPTSRSRSTSRSRRSAGSSRRKSAARGRRAAARHLAGHARGPRPRCARSASPPAAGGRPGRPGRTAPAAGPWARR